MISLFLNERDLDTIPYNTFVTKMLYFILTNNTFTFDGSQYPQVQGVAMGIKCAPMYVNLYLGGWEREVFESDCYSTYLRHTLFSQ